MQLPRSIYSSGKPSAGDIPDRPQGARPNPRKGLGVIDTSKFASLMQNSPPSRQLRALPAVPPGLNSMLGPSQTRPLPCCPSSSLLTSQPLLPSSTRSAKPSAGVHSPPVAIPIPVLSLRQRNLSPPPVPPKDPVKIRFALRKHDDDDCAFDMESIRESKRPSGVHLDSEYTREVIIRGNVEKCQPKGYKRVTDLRWILGKRMVPQQPTTQNSSATKKWVKDKKGQRATIKNYDKILQELRTL